MEYSCFRMGGYKGIDGLRTVAYAANSFIWGTVLRTILLLAVIFKIYFKNECPFKEGMIMSMHITFI